MGFPARALRNAAIVAGLAAAMTCAPMAGAEPVVIKVDWTVVPQQFAPLIPGVPRYAPDLYRHYGKSYVVEPIRFQGGGVSLSALAVGETHLSTLSPQALVLGIVNAKLDLRVIGQQISTEMPGHLQTWFWVKKDRIATVDDLKGKVVGVNARGSAIDAAAAIVLARHGLAAPRDFQFLELAFPFQLDALRAGKIDAAILIPPFSADAASDPTLKPLFSLGRRSGRSRPRSGPASATSSRRTARRWSIFWRIISACGGGCSIQKPGPMRSGCCRMSARSQPRNTPAGSTPTRITTMIPRPWSTWDGSRRTSTT